MELVANHEQILHAVATKCAGRAQKCRFPETAAATHLWAPSTAASVSDQQNGKGKARRENSQETFCLASISPTSSSSWPMIPESCATLRSPSAPSSGNVESGGRTSPTGWPVTAARRFE